MKAIILAAGYATRLYPLTRDIPKPLLPVAGKANIEYILSHLLPVEDINAVYIITNDKFYQQFVEWEKGFSKKHHTDKKIDIMNDGTSTNESRLGSTGDIDLVISKKGLDDDLLIIAGDSLFDFELNEMINYFHEKNSSRIIDFKEKPKWPDSDIAVPAIHIYKKDTLNFFGQYLSEGNNPDSPGYFVDWLFKKEPLYAYFFTGNCYDIGNAETYYKVNQIFS
jgi:glucose-1-phosphate thymidylyltransferase